MPAGPAAGRSSIVAALLLCRRRLGERAGGWAVQAREACHALIRLVPAALPHRSPVVALRCQRANWHLLVCKGIDAPSCRPSGRRYRLASALALRSPMVPQSLGNMGQSQMRGKQNTCLHYVVHSANALRDARGPRTLAGPAASAPPCAALALQPPEPSSPTVSAALRLQSSLQASISHLRPLDSSPALRRSAHPALSTPPESQVS